MNGSGGLRYRCLILDHDDTAVDSTRVIHYPAHLAMLSRLRPRTEPIDLEGWYLKNFDPGIMGYLTGELHMTPQELAEEFTIWREYTASRVPEFFPGFVELLSAFRRRGGFVTVVSHSEREIIERDYRLNAGGDAPLPDVIYGWDHEESRRKPSPWPVMQILERLSVKPEEALIIDDLKPAVLMGRASGVDVAAAGWSHHVPEIRRYMEANCVAYFERIEDLTVWLLGS